MSNENHEVIPLNDFNDTDTRYRAIFDRCDGNNDGYICVWELEDFVNSNNEDVKLIPRHVVGQIHKMADENGDRKLDYREFVQMIQHPDLQHIFGQYVTHSLFYLTDEINERGSTMTGTGITAQIFIYDPKKRHEFWRYLTYMFVHIGYAHLCVNLAVQLILGVPLEMVHKWWRVLTIYFAGVIAGSLANSITDPNCRLAGASGGVYALLTAHIACVIMNWSEMMFPYVQLLIYSIIVICDIGQSVYDRYFLDVHSQVGIAAHFGGALAGLLVGIYTLRNLQVTTREKYIFWGAVVLYVALMGAAIIINVAWPALFANNECVVAEVEFGRTMQEEGDLPSPVRKVKHEYYKSIFDKYDTDKSGHIDLKELREMLKDDDEVPRRIVNHIFETSDKDNDGKINYNEFMEMVHNRKFKEVFGRYIDTYIRYVLPPQHRHAQLPTNESLEDGEGLYEEHYSCCPPPLAMFIISVIEFACFLTDQLTRENIETDRGITADSLIYDPYKRREFWRYLTYMFVHVGYSHLVVNLSVQLLLGIFLEMVHKWWRILPVYFSGVVAGSLATSIADPTSYLAELERDVLPGVQLFIFFIITTVDIGTSIYNRYYLDIYDHVAYAAHFAGAISGLLIGIWVLKNFVPTKKETYIWWFAFVIYILLVVTMVMLNVAWTNNFLK
ncbi:hypothetical protein NQ317_018247 [Molorchus minor]|uniref:EF-hand domain-containing protein n=1 Tax=Molorchus minor TaxID=1323400 RepID=A0ABQ9K3N5_9CUCU|nr:hypothetical protein NQ317_018247 [Molorchus minor]